ncbi:MAG: cation-transporting P-type ATPase [Desulfobacterales bacterium]|jgi:Ca2+-transporting ATPase|nr:cation-transporting P-type ATPase [Desulfobacterales bacterium]
MLELIHSLPGRARFRIPQLRRDRERANLLDQALRAAVGVHHVAVSPTTGSVLVRFGPAQPLAEVRALIARALVEPEQRRKGRPAAPQRPPPPPALREEGSPQPWHRMKAGEVLRVFNVSPRSGLSRREAGLRHRLHGANLLPATAGRSFAAILKGQVSELPVFLVAAAAALSILVGGVAEGLVALAIALFNALASSVAENRAERMLDEVRAAIDLKARVCRTGKVFEIGFGELVPGDILDLQVGSRIPADARLVAADHLAVDEAALTGESIPVFKSAAVPADPDPLFSQRSNMVYRGTLVVEGSGRAVVVATGTDTVLGRLQVFLGAVFPPEAAVARDMRWLIRHFLMAGMGVGGVFGLFSLLRGQGLFAALREALSLVAGAIPSGLSTLSASALAFGHRDLGRRRILVRRLRALGNLASTQIVCFDKTGTLTLNEMSVTGLCAGWDRVDPAAAGGRSAVGPHPSAAGGDLDWLIRLGVLCNEAFMIHEGAQSLEGSSTEKALIHFAEENGINSTRFRGEHPIVEIFHRTENHPYMVTVHQWSEDQELTAIKGAPFDVLELCRHCRQGGETHPLSDDARARIEAENFRMAGQGLRVLGLAFGWGRAGTEEGRYTDGTNLVWAGLVGLADPVRSEARELVQTLHRSGIRTAVLTGDQGLTAQHIGAQLGLSGSEPLRILDAAELRGVALSGMSGIVTRTHVFARLTPAQKLQIIQAYQSAGLSVVMVGDGFNDVLALKVADVGIAMGRKGADMACKAADLILENDDLGGVCAAIQGGRRFYGNMRKSLRFLSGATYVDLAAAALAKSAVAGGMHPLQPVWANTAALALAVDPGDDHEVGGLPEAGTAVIGRGQISGSLSDAAAVMAASSLVGAYAFSRYGGGAPAQDLFRASVGLNQLTLALGENPAGRRPGAARRWSPVLWGAAAAPLLMFALTGGGMLDLLALAGGGWLARQLLARGGPGTELPHSRAVQ